MLGQKGKVDDVDRMVSQQLKHKRRLLGLSQQEVAEALGVSVQQIQKYERATNRITSGKLYSLGRILRTPVSEFFQQGIDLQNASSNFAEEQEEYVIEEEIPEKEIANLVRSYLSIKNPQTRKKITELIKSMA